MLHAGVPRPFNPSMQYQQTREEYTVILSRTEVNPGMRAMRNGDCRVRLAISKITRVVRQMSRRMTDR